MNRNSMLTIGIATGWLAIMGLTISAQDKYTVKVPGGLAFSDFRGYEGWQAISLSRNENVFAMILGNPVMIDAYRASDTFTPGTTAGTPPQGNDARCGVACHTRAKATDYVFTEYGKR